MFLIHHFFMTITVITGIVALAAGLGVGYLVAWLCAQKTRNTVLTLQNRLQQTNADFVAREAFLRQTHAEILRQKELAHADALTAMEKQFSAATELMRAQLQATTEKMLKERQADFAQTSRNNIAEILAPLNDNLARFNDALTKNTQANTLMQGQLGENIRQMMEHSDAARNSADRLADALRGGGRIQGDWGETVLTELLESQGLREGVHFETQKQVLATEKDDMTESAEQRLRPDVILRLDNDRRVVIDSKVSLSAYLEMMEAADDVAREAALKRHIASIGRHVDALARKDYARHLGVEYPLVDYVIMFVPCSAALHAATTADTALWRNAMARGVYIADEQTLYAALKIISLTWKQIAQVENHHKIFHCADELVDRVSAFVKLYGDLGRSLNATLNAYQEGQKKLADGGQSIPASARKLVQLGASESKNATRRNALTQMS